MKYILSMAVLIILSVSQLQANEAKAPKKSVSGEKRAVAEASCFGNDDIVELIKPLAAQNLSGGDLSAVVESKNSKKSVEKYLVGFTNTKNGNEARFEVSVVPGCRVKSVIALDEQ